MTFIVTICYGVCMTTDSDINHHLPLGNANWGAVRAALGLLAIVQLLLLSVYFEYAAGYFISSFALGCAAFYFLMTLSRLNKTHEMVSIPGVTVQDHIGSDLFDDLPVPMIEADENGEILQANAATCALIGRDDLVGATLDSIVEGLGRSIRDVWRIR